MKIIILDIDDTITYETRFLIKYAPEYLKKNELETSIINPNGNNMDEIFGIQEQLMLKREKKEKDAYFETKRITDTFWERYFIKYNREKIKPGVAKYISKMKNAGYEIHFLTLRGRKTRPKEGLVDKFIRISIVPAITRAMLKRNNISFDRLVMVQTEEEKLEYIKHYSPDIVFDNQISLLKKIHEQNELTKLVLVTENPNTENISLKNIIQIKSFSEIEPAIDFSKDRKEPLLKKLSLKVKLQVLFQYFVIYIGRVYFIWKYRPIISGRENLLHKGSVVFVGNHRHKLDPVFISASSLQSIHWGALLRMFQGKEDLFSLKSGKFKRELSAKFISLMGALPIARSTDENYNDINSNTFRIFSDILAQKGKVGLFPEGTINRNPVECNILSLKSDRVFRLAVETQSYIQPFSIVWVPENIKSRNRLIVSYSKPINTRNRNQEQVKEMWTDLVESMIEESKQIISELDQRK